jgi:hypothetical protein
VREDSTNQCHSTGGKQNKAELKEGTKAWVEGRVLPAYEFDEGSLSRMTTIADCGTLLCVWLDLPATGQLALTQHMHL